MDIKITKLLEAVTEEMNRLDTSENAICAVMGKLEDFTLQASRSKDSLTDIWNSWNPLKKDVNIKCWEIKQCNNAKCDAYRQDHMKCWMLTNTVCCATAKSYSQKLSTCFSCAVMAKLREDTPLYLNELINVLIKFLMIRDKDLIDIAIKDALTGAYNRFYFDEYIKHEIVSAERHDDCISFIVIDIDKFKSVNDTYGHSVGDDVLKTVSSILKESVRAIDMVFRMGGDEFLIVFPRTKCSGVGMIKDRIISETSKWNEVNRIENKYPGYALSLSIGCSTWRKGDELDKKIVEADSLMYSMKEK